jgi:hypothetical protein
MRCQWTTRRRPNRNGSKRLCRSDGAASNPRRPTRRSSASASATGRPRRVAAVGRTEQELRSWVVQEDGHHLTEKVLGGLGLAPPVTKLREQLDGSDKAVNAQDEDAIVATFADGALVNDAHREFWGTVAIRRWVAKEMVGDKITLKVTGVIEHYGETIVRGCYDGAFDRGNLPDEVILSNYFTVRDAEIVRLIVIRNTPAY